MSTNANSSPMRNETWLEKASEKLELAGIGTARLDCLVLLEDAAKKDRAFLLAHPEFELNAKQLGTLSAQIERRKQHEPLAFIRGKTEFYGREFVLNKYVLEPRPESETMIDLLKGLKLPVKAKIADVGSGSGAIGITAKLELPNSEVVMYEIDKKAIVISNKNAKLHKVPIETIECDLLDKATEMPDVILANLPYVPNNYQINTAALMEPRIAIFGGVDGLDLYRNLFQQLNERHWKPFFILTESLPFQHKDLLTIAKDYGYQQIDENDFIQLFTPLEQLQV